MIKPEEGEYEFKCVCGELVPITQYCRDYWRESSMLTCPKCKREYLLARYIESRDKEHNGST